MSEKEKDIWAIIGKSTCANIIAILGLLLALGHIGFAFTMWTLAKPNTVIHMADYVSVKNRPDQFWVYVPCAITNNGDRSDVIKNAYISIKAPSGKNIIRIEWDGFCEYKRDELGVYNYMLSEAAYPLALPPKQSISKVFGFSLNKPENVDDFITNSDLTDNNEGKPAEFILDIELESQTERKTKRFQFKLIRIPPIDNESPIRWRDMNQPEYNIVKYE